MFKAKINKKVLMSGADYFTVEELNPYSHKEIQPDSKKASKEHQSIANALVSAGIDIARVKAPKDCQDGIYTANWALVIGNKAILSSLPNMRQAEQPYARKHLEKLGKDIIEPPYLFSGQGDALPCGNLLFCGSGYRTDPRMHDFLAEQTGLEVISLKTVPLLDTDGQEAINPVTGLADSYFYDIDLALAVISDDLIAWCPEAFTDESQDKIYSLKIKKIEVTLQEAMGGFACNLVSSGSTVIMSSHTPLLQTQLEALGYKTITPEIKELSKGGGYIRCTTLTI
jgi:N-dimethylarginine dimethylaminohydrolase